jgi:pimeloyl-ACP methyl ester carboxylesterase
MSTHNSTSENTEGTDLQPNGPPKIQQVQPIPISEEEMEQQPLLHQDYLDPGDPRVSPLNLKYIRWMRFALLVLLVVNVGLFVIFLISDFINIPGFYNPGKSFLELDLLLICSLANLLSIWCFDVPAKFERIIGFVSAGLFILDAIVVFFVPKLKHQFGTVGGVVLIWTCANIIFESVANYYVEQGRNYQEVRLSGRIETRRTLKEIIIMFGKSCFKFVLLLLVWNISLTVWISAFDSHEGPWGELISVADDKFNIHLACYGNITNDKVDESHAQPIVLVEGGQLTSSEVFQEWVEELYHLNKIDRYCIWDRPGYGWSDSAPSPISIGMIVEYLIEALDKKGVSGPFSLVGFDIGGLYSRMFASKRPELVHSLLLVDSWHQDLLKSNPFSGTNRKKELTRVFKNNLELMNIRTGLKLWIKGLISPLGLYSNLHLLVHPYKYSSKSRIFGRDMRWSPKYLRARLQEQITSSFISYYEIESSDLHNLPMSIISSDYMIKQSLNWGKWQREISKLSSNTVEWVIAENSSHFIWQSPKGKEQLQQLLIRLVAESGYNAHDDVMTNDMNI